MAEAYDEFLSLFELRFGGSKVINLVRQRSTESKARFVVIQSSEFKLQLAGRGNLKVEL
jgi:hypothetical protein